MESCLHLLLDDSVVSFCFRNMLLGVGVVDGITKFICKWVHERAKLVIT